jgi:iron-sulfur cluster assembly protein
MQVIHFSTKALEAIESYKKNLQIQSNHFLRIGIKEKSNNEKGLIIGFDEVKEQDKKTIINGLEIIYQASHLLYFAGMEIDFVERNGQKGFELVGLKK